MARTKARDITESLGKPVPQAVELEAMVLGAMIMERPSLMLLIDRLNPEDFYDERHKVTFEAILELHQQNKKVDGMTVAVQLMKKGMIELVGGPSFPSELTSKVSTGHHSEEHALIVVENSLRRKLINASGDIQSEAYDQTVDVFETLDNLQKKIDQITGNKLTEGFKKTGKVVQEAFQRIRDIQNNKGISGVPSLPSIDRILGGWQPGLIVIAGRPGMGKTAFVGMICEVAAIIHKIPVALFSLEMSSVQIVNRMISTAAEVELEKLVRGTLDENEWTKVNEKTQALQEAPIFIDDTTALHYLQLRSKVRKMVVENNVGLIVIDYLQLMKGDNKSGNREQEISSISSALKNLSKEINRPIIALSQLSREVDKREEKRPQLSDLRESGAIEQDANIVAFLFRAEYYKKKHFENGESTEGVLEFIVAKHRDGGLDKAKLKFVGKFTKVMEFPDTGKQGNIFSKTDDVPF